MREIDQQCVSAHARHRDRYETACAKRSYERVRDIAVRVGAEPVPDTSHPEDAPPRDRARTADARDASPPLIAMGLVAGEEQAVTPGLGGERRM